MLLNDNLNVTDYESPINIIFKDLGTEIDGLVVTATQEVGVTVNKEELLKALMYDRDQYNKGRADGLKAATIDELVAELKSRLITTNLEYVRTLNEKELTRFIFDVMLVIGRRYADSRVGIEQWLSEPYNREEIELYSGECYICNLENE